MNFPISWTISADKYVVPVLVNICISKIQAILPQFVFEIYDKAEGMNHAKLKEVCLKSIDKNTIEAFELCDKPETIDLELLKTILERDSLLIDELQLFYQVKPIFLLEL